MRTMRCRGGLLLKTALVLVVLSGRAQALPTTAVQDVLYNADGTTVEGTVTISWAGFTASDGSTVATNSITVRVVQGVLRIGLTPNENATPAGTSYRVTYLLDNGSRFFETWVVPESAETVTVSQVRVTQTPVASAVIAQSQVNSLVGDLAGKADLDLPNIFTATQTIQESAPGSTLLSFREAGGPNAISFGIPSLSASTAYTWPSFDGVSGQQLTTDGSGNLFWADGGSGAGPGTVYEIFQNSGSSVTQRNLANFANGLQVFDNLGDLRTEVQPVYGSGAGTVTEGNDPRLSDARTPVAHASSHAAGGSDPVTPVSIGALKNQNDTISTASPSLTPLDVMGASGQTAPLQTWRDGEGTLMALIAPEGTTFVRQMGINSDIGGTVANLIMQVDGTDKFAMSAFDTALNFGRYDDLGVFKDNPLQILRNGGTLINTELTVNDPTTTTGVTSLTVKAGEGQGTTSLQEWQDSAGVALTSLDAGGNLLLNGHYLGWEESSAPPTPGPDEVRLFFDASSGEISVKKDDGSVVSLEQGGGGSFGVFQDAESPSGTADGVNTDFTLAAAPNPPESLTLTRNGLVQEAGSDFTLSGDTITFLAGAIPQSGDSLLAWYRTDASQAGGDLNGSYPNPVVDGLQGNAVSNAAPSDGDCLVWSGGGSEWAPAACGKVTSSLQWHFTGAPSAGAQPMILVAPEGITGAVLTDARIVANTPGSTASTFNVERCTSACTGTSPVFSGVYASDVTLALDTRTATGGAPTTTTVNAGDQFRVNLVSLGSGASDITVSLTYQYLATN